MAQTIGIFSRSGETDYDWLTQRLGGHCKVLSVYISNHNCHVLLQQINQCRYAILYHTKNRGRVNITDVTDSLYDEEIVLLSDRLGKDQVLAVIDDLEESNEEAKERIMSSQPTLRDKTHDIFLFTRTEKQNEELLREKVQPIIDMIQGDEEKPLKSGSIYARCLKGHPERVVTVAVTSCIVFKEAYRVPHHRNLVLASLWAAGLSRVLFRKPSEYFWFNPRIHSMVFRAVTLISFYNVYCRPNTANAGLSAFWLIYGFVRADSRRRRLDLKKWVLRSMGCGLVCCSFWKGWEMRNAAKVSELMVQSALCSPAILAAL